MGSLPSFQFHRPETLEGACEILEEYAGRARVLAGGTDLLVMMKQQVVQPSVVVFIKHLQSLRGVRKEEDETWRIGPGMTLHEVETDPGVRRRFAPLAEAAGCVASLQVRHMATLGGNVCLDTKCWYLNQSWMLRRACLPCIREGGESCTAVPGGLRCYALFSADTVPALLALGAQIKLTGARGSRRLSLEDLYTGDGHHPYTLKPGEILSDIYLSQPEGPWGGVYLKHGHPTDVEFAVVGVAVVLGLDEGREGVRWARVRMGALESRPLNGEECESILREGPIEADRIRRAARAAAREIHPAFGYRATVGYKKRVTETVVERAIHTALERAGAKVNGQAAG
ncbi:MAG: FAD binding domain-containing protein [Nitrospinota bacterium]|jgi:4-hydroxybenzoyl-CoA reductase subunit beta|nr:FAD binding domain-containing protein [Nitrospinota bacterium]MDP7387190.1 FAD binding domain-containing protein [Nitrospinota bacterium]